MLRNASMRKRPTRSLLRKPSSAPPEKQRSISLDTWLVRGSHIAQLGLFVLTLLALFYTVIPLYKTAALEEQIARKEAELSETQRKIGQAESALKEANEKMYRRSRSDVLLAFVRYAGPSCSGL